MKNLIIFTILVVSAFLFSNAINAQNTTPEKPIKTEKNLEHSADLSELCVPDWSGYDKISPDISTRALIYPKVTSNKKQKKVNENMANPTPDQPVKIITSPKPTKK